jgi:hypothetical protein
MDVQGSGGGGAVVPAEVPQYYLPLRGSIPTGPTLVYQAGVLAAATVNFVAGGSGVSTSTRIRRVATAPESSLALDWEKATPMETTLEDMDRQPASGGTLAPLPAAMGSVSSYRSWGSDFSDWAFRTQTLETFKSLSSGLTSNPGETEADFRARVAQVATAKQNDAIEKLKAKYASRKQTLDSQLLRAQQARQRESEQSRGRMMQTAISFGATVLGGIFGRKTFGTSTIGRATTAMRDVGRTIDQAGDVKRADQTLADIQQKVADLETQQQNEIDALTSKTDPATEALEKILMRPRKSDITVDALGLVWMPYWKDASGNMTPTWG